MGFCVGWRKDLERWGGRELYFGLGTGELRLSFSFFHCFETQLSPRFSHRPLWVHHHLLLVDASDV